jgi:hypothetical protein
VLFSAFLLSSPSPPFALNLKLPVVLRDQNPAYKTGPYHSLRLDDSGTALVRNGGIHLEGRTVLKLTQPKYKYVFFKRTCRIFDAVYTEFVLRPKAFDRKCPMGGKHQLSTRDSFCLYAFLLTAYLIRKKLFSVATKRNNIFLNEIIRTNSQFSSDLTNFSCTYRTDNVRTT